MLTYKRFLFTELGENNHYIEILPVEVDALGNITKIYTLFSLSPQWFLEDKSTLDNVQEAFSTQVITKHHLLDQLIIKRTKQLSHKINHLQRVK